MATSSHWRVCTQGDPKFWPAALRHIILANICFFVFLGNLYAAGIATGFASLAREFRVDFGVLGDIISYPVLALGVGNLFWTPTAICFGKRPTILISMLLFLVFCIWSIYARNLNELIASRVLACFAAGSIESLGPAIISDLYMERYFATAMAVFSLFLSGGAQVGPTIAGYLIKSRGWRWFFILNAILIGINLGLSLLLLPETNFKRVFFEGETAAEMDKQAVEEIEHSHKITETDTSTSAPNESWVGNQAYAGSYWADLVTFRNRGLESGISAWVKQLSLPFRFIFVPHVLFAALSYGAFLGGIVLISILSPKYFSPPPYLLSPSGLGLFTLGSFVGIIVGYPIAGPVTDALSRRITKKKGQHEPEHRIPALIIPFIICPPGLILFAYIVSQKGSLYVAAVGNALQAAALVLVPSVVLSVVVDAYPETGSEAMVLINAGKNLVAFGITLGSTSWVASQGLKNMFWQMAAIQWAVLVFAAPLYYFGPKLRQKTMSLV